MAYKSVLENLVTNKNILITGGIGFVGVYLVKKIISLSPKKLIILSQDKITSIPYSNTHTQKNSNIVFLEIGDISNKRGIESLMSRHNIQGIFHLAAQAKVKKDGKYTEPYENFSVNTLGTLNILESARVRRNIKFIIITSSGLLPPSLTNEEQIRISGFYGISKISADLLALAYGVIYNLPISVARFDNIYGPGDSNINRIIPSSIISGLKGELFKPKSNKPRRFIYIEDVIDGYIQMLRQWDLVKGKCVYFRGERFYTTKISSIIFNCINKKTSITSNVPRQKKTIMSCKNNSLYRLANDLIGWKTRTSFGEGVKKSIEWYIKNKNLFV